MPAHVLTTSPQTQVTASLDVLTPGFTAAVTNLVLKNRIGPAQPIMITLNIDGTVDVELNIVVFDDAFDDVDMFGGPKGRGSGEAEISGKQQL